MARLWGDLEGFVQVVLAVCAVRPRPALLIAFIGNDVDAKVSRIVALCSLPFVKSLLGVARFVMRILLLSEVVARTRQPLHPADNGHYCCELRETVQYVCQPYFEVRFIRSLYVESTTSTISHHLSRALLAGYNDSVHPLRQAAGHVL